MALNKFGNFVRIKGSNWAKYEEKKAVAGNIIFADLDGDATHEASKLIWANGIEYVIPDNSDIIERLNTLDGSVLDISTLIDSYELKVVNNVISIDGIEGSVTVEGKDYVNVTTADNKISVSIDSSVMHGQNEATADDVKLTTKKYVDDAIADSGANVDASIAVDNKDAILKIETSNNNGDVISTNKVAIKTNDYVTIENDTLADGTAVKLNVNVASSVDEIENAIATDASLTTSYAVREYVEGKLGDIANAVTLEGGIAELETELASTNLTDVNVGDQFIADSAKEFTIGEGDNAKTYKAEIGDSIFVTKIENGKVAGVTIVEKNLDGAVTANETLTENYVVIGGGNQTIKSTLYKLGADSSVNFGNDSSKLATEIGVKDYVEYKTTTVKLADATEQNDGLATSLDVSLAIADAITNAEGEISAIEGDVNSAAVQFAQGDIDSSVTFVGDLDTFVHVTVDTDTNSIKFDVSTCTLEDASLGKDGLALASDVHRVIIENEEVVSAAISATANKIGLEEDFTIDWTGTEFDEETTIIDAIKSLVAGQFNEAVVNSIDGVSGQLTLETASETAGDVNLSISEDGVLSADIVNLEGYVSSAIDSSIADLTINDKHFENKAITLDGTDIKVGGDSALKDKTIEEVIKDLDGGVVKSIDTNTDNFIEMTASEADEDGNVTIDASITLANAVDLSSVTNATSASATGIATDAYVQDAIALAMAWEIID